MFKSDKNMILLSLRFMIVVRFSSRDVLSSFILAGVKEANAMSAVHLKLEALSIVHHLAPAALSQDRATPRTDNL